MENQWATFLSEGRRQENVLPYALANKKHVLANVTNAKREYTENIEKNKKQKKWIRGQHS